MNCNSKGKEQYVDNSFTEKSSLHVKNDYDTYEGINSSDCRVTEGEGWLMMRAGTQNSKGIVDQYRRPKLAYDTIKKYWCK